MIYHTYIIYIIPSFNALINIFKLQPEKTFVNLLDDVIIYHDPYGVALVMGAWNYPIQLLLVPVAAAIAAGNCVVVKPSEVAESCSKLMEDLVTKYLDNVRIFHIIKEYFL